MQCIVCETEGAERAPGGNARFNCRRCGSFVLSGTAERTIETKLNEKPLRRSLMSHTLRRMQQPGDKHLRVITDDQLPTFWRNERLPTPQKLADNLILWIGDNQETPFRSANIDRSAIAAWIGLPISLPNDTDGWVWLHNQLDVKSLYQHGEVRQGRILDLKLSMYGWETYERLKHLEIASRTAFMAMKFNQSDVNHAVESCFRPAVGRTGFELRVLTHGQPAGSIDDQLRAGIVASRFVIADLTHGSPGAYWEAGFGEGLGRPVIYTCGKSAWEKQGTHFDTNHLTHIIWNPEDLTEAENRLVATIRATFRADAKQTDD
jgi:nucleoside 2-deoxyribosyltransferase